MSGKKKIAYVGVSAIVAVAMVIAVTVGVTHLNKKEQASPLPGGGISTTTKAIISVCQPTDYRETCEKSLSAMAGNTSDPKELIKVAFQVAIDEIKRAAKNSTALKELIKDPRSSHSVEICAKLFDYSIIDLQRSIKTMGRFDISKLDDFVEELNSWLSGSLTHQTTCLDMFVDNTDDLGEKMKEILKTSRELTINGLNIVTEISSILNSLHVPGVGSVKASNSKPIGNEWSGLSCRRLLSEQDEVWVKEFPSWITAGQRRLLGATPASIKPDMIVAKDGSGKFKTIREAVKTIPMNSTKRFVVYVKQGVYNEQVIIPIGMNNVMFISDGPTRTKVTGSLNDSEKKKIFESASFAVEGDGFIAKDMGFENTAGPLKGAAVALRVQSPRSIIYNCQMDGYQDTVWAVSYKQFYRDCIISGSVDFIFGNAESVFQNCKIIVKCSTYAGQHQSVILAPRREHLNESTALVLQNCTISASPEYLTNRKSRTLEAYLARPWKELARTIIMQSQIDEFIHPEGWMKWNSKPFHETCFFAEYGNRGPGSVLTQRPKWGGVKKITPQQVLDFTAGKFIQADMWIKPTGVPYVSGMMAGL